MKKLTRAELQKALELEQGRAFILQQARGEAVVAQDQAEEALSVEREHRRSANFATGLYIVLATALSLTVVGALVQERTALEAATKAMLDRSKTSALVATVDPDADGWIGGPTTDNAIKICSPEGVCQFPSPWSTAHSLEIALSAPCWLKITEQTPAAKVLVEGKQPTAYKHVFSFDEQTTLEVRAGCPGSVLYKVDGVETFPVNKSGKPKDSEVVDLLL